MAKLAFQCWNHQAAQFKISNSAKYFIKFSQKNSGCHLEMFYTITAVEVEGHQYNLCWNLLPHYPRILENVWLKDRTLPKLLKVNQIFSSNFYHTWKICTISIFSEYIYVAGVPSVWISVLSISPNLLLLLQKSLCYLLKLTFSQWKHIDDRLFSQMLSNNFVC